MPLFRTLVLAAAALCLAAPALAAETDAKPFRLIGEAPSAKDPAPRRFIVEGVMKPGDGEFQSTLEGWFAGLDDPAPNGSIDGSCVEKHCALSLDVDGSKFALSGEFGAVAGPTTVRFTVKDDEGKTVQQGPATLRPLTGAVPGLGALAPAGAIDAAELDTLLVWNHQNTGFGGNDPGDPVGSFQRGAVADWQKGKGRVGTGLIFTTDLAELRADAQAARTAAGWTALGDKAHGWSAGYPSALLPKASRAAGEQRFASADGKTAVAVAVDPPMTGEVFDAYIAKTTADREGRTGVNYTRVNGDLQMRYEEKGVVTVVAVHNRENALARLTFTYPVAAADTWSPYEAILQHELKVTDDLKR